MFANWIRANKLFLSSFFLCFALLGCKQTIPIENGSVVGELSGKAGESQMFSITVPESMDGLLIQASGNETVNIDLLDESKNSLGLCPSARVCLIDHPSSAKYLIKLSSSADYSDVSVTASWGGEDDAVLQNNTEEVGVAVPAAGILLKSFYLPESQPMVLIESTAIGDSNIQIVDRFGELRADCSELSPCRAGQLPEGLYYLRLESGDGFPDGSLKAIWGDATGVTLQNGVSKAVSGAEGEQVVNSLYLPAGADSLLVSYNQMPAYVDILDESDAVLQSCGYHQCSLEGLGEGVYRIRATMQADVAAGYLTAAWGGSGLSLITNGGVMNDLRLPAGGGYLIPVYLSDPVESALVDVDPEQRLDLRVYDSRGESISECLELHLCYFDVEQSGTYFIHVENFTAEQRTSDLSAAWAGLGVHSLADGADAKNYSLEQNEGRLESFYLPENVMGAMIRLGGNAMGQVIAPGTYGGGLSIQESCQDGSPCAISNSHIEGPLIPGPYFVRILNTQEMAVDFNLAMAWAGEGYMSLGNGVKGSEHTLSMNHTMLEVVSLPPGRKSAAALALSDVDLNVDIFSMSGDYIQSCRYGELCAWEGDLDFYYLSTINNSESSTSAAFLSAWANEAVATFTSE